MIPKTWYDSESISIAGWIAKAVDEAAERGCDVFQIFSRNPRGLENRRLIVPKASLRS